MLRFLYIIKNENIIYQNETGTWGIFLMTIDWSAHHAGKNISRHHLVEYETVILLSLDPLETEL